MSNIIKTGTFQARVLHENLTIFKIGEIDTTGVTVSDKAILSPFGLDPICNEISVQELPFSTDSELTLKLALSFEGKWNGLDDFIQKINSETGFSLKQEPHPYKPQHSNLFMIGKTDEIMELGKALRDGLVTEKLEVDPADFPIVHPELIGQAMEKVSSIIEEKKDRVSPNTAFSYKAYSHDWAM